MSHARTVRLNVVSLLILVLAWVGAVVAATQQALAVAAVLAIGGTLLSMSPKAAKQWERGVVLRLGRYIGLRGPGLFWIVPLVDDVARWVDHDVARGAGIA